MSGLSVVTTPQITDMRTIERIEFRIPAGETDAGKALLLKPNYDDLLGNKTKNTSGTSYIEYYYGYSWEVSSDNFAPV